MGSGRAGLKAAQIVINGPDYHQLVIGPDAFAAQDTLAEIPDNKGIGLFEGLEIGHGVEVRLADSQIGGDLAQLTAVALAADNAGFRVLGNHEAHDIATMFDDARGCGLQNHVPDCGGDTGSHQTSGIFIFHQTHAAGAKRLQVRMMTEPGDFYAMLFSSVQNARSGRTGDFFAVNGQRDGIQGGGSFVLFIDDLI
jgi:hypothetical protein